MVHRRFINVKLSILYGSQSGNAQDLAERIGRESKCYHFASRVSPMDDYNIVDLVRETCVIFVCSTTGQGEEPDNMKQFWRFLLRRSLPRDSLVNVRFAVLGLGDSSYIKFNFVAKRLHKRLLQLGGQSLVSLGLADDQHDLGYDAAADPWIEELWKSLLLLYPLPDGVQILDKHQPIIPRWNVLLENYNRSLGQPKSIYFSTRPSDEFTVTVKSNIRMTHIDHYQDVRLIKLIAPEQHYEPGDVIVLRPRNSSHQISEFQRILRENSVDISPESIFNIRETNANIPVPQFLQNQVTFQQLCEEYFDLTAIPRRQTFEILAQLTDSEVEREKCLEFTTAEGQTDLYNYCSRPKRNITEVLDDFRHATKHLTKDMLFELLPVIKPRDFSIASSCKYHKGEIHILVAVVRYKTKLVKDRLGLASNYLAELSEGVEMRARIKKGSFKFPTNDVPVIMVGPGTGVAPFKSFIYERLARNVATNTNSVLFFGNRYRNMDFLCKDLETLHQRSEITLVTAFSRDQEYKIYVQHKLREHAAFLWDLLYNHNALIFVAGNAKNMPQCVREAFVHIAIEEGRQCEQDAEAFIANLEKSNRYQTETWA